MEAPKAMFGGGLVHVEQDGTLAIRNLSVSALNFESGAAIHAALVHAEDTFTMTHSHVETDETALYHSGAGVVPSSIVGGDPMFSSVFGSDPEAWNLTLQPGSPLLDAGDPTLPGEDGTRSDIGAYGGPEGDSW